MNELTQAEEGHIAVNMTVRQWHELIAVLHSGAWPKVCFGTPEAMRREALDVSSNAAAEALHILSRSNPALKEVGDRARLRPKVRSVFYDPND